MYAASGVPLRLEIRPAVTTLDLAAWLGGVLEGASHAADIAPGQP
jgi:hypothetical protein